ncbi:CBL-interacting protein kinase 1 [Ananas comosus]|uniref:non-specific serine/threonine protein kinase n=1 Tax=Ananas comosus TaxID=4615 RepID=A0A199VIP6_ANACO|nr:CBL-interacting protein kinase 1 [Ananas comosus]
MDGGEAMRVGPYLIGRTIGEGSFAKVKAARRADTGGAGFALKIILRSRVGSDLKIHDQIKREIGTLKMLRHPNVVRLYEVLASKTKIFLVLEHVTGGELFDKIESKRRISEREGRKLFQQLIDAVSYCHDRGVYHRDLKPENVLLDAKGNIKISDFGLSALPQQFGVDGLLHTTCGSPNYVAPEVLANRGYDGAKSDLWSCGVILYVILTGCLPFDDQNLTLLYHKISKSEVHIPKWLSPGAQNLIKRMLDPNPITRINMDQLKEDNWFKQDYVPVMPEGDEEEDMLSDDESCVIKEVAEADHGHENTHNHINAFELIGMCSSLDLSGFFEQEDVSERRIRFTSTLSPKDLFDRIEEIVTEMGFHVRKGHAKLKVIQPCKGSTCPRSLLMVVEVFEINSSLYVVELRKSHGICAKILDDLGVCKSADVATTNQSLMQEHSTAALEGERKFTIAAA